MSPATVLEVAEGLADALTSVSPEFPVQVSPRMLFAPTPPAIDIFPATPSQSDLAFGAIPRKFWFIVRYRVATEDREAVQDALYAALDVQGPSSVRAALMANKTLNGIADDIEFDANTPSGFYLVEDGGGSSGVLRYLTVDWRVGVLVSK